jgi:phosphatidylglycerophosphatase A
MKNLPKDADPSEVVVDEMAGLALVLAVMPLSWIGYIAGFVAFRLFDIWKPAFIGWCDRNVKGPWGVMLDDLAAALPAALLASPVWFL